MAAVLKRIRDEGPLLARDFETPKGHSQGWWNWKPAKRALEQLFMQGDLMIAGRDGFQKVYDLPERVLPPGTDTHTANGRGIRRPPARYVAARTRLREPETHHLRPPGYGDTRGVARAARRRCGRREPRQVRRASTPTTTRGPNCSIGAVRARPRAYGCCRRSTIRSFSATATSRCTTTTTSSSAMCRRRNDASATSVCRSCIATRSSAASIAKRSAASGASTSCICTSSATSTTAIASSPRSPRRRANSQRSTTATTVVLVKVSPQRWSTDVRKALAAGV